MCQKFILPKKRRYRYNEAFILSFLAEKSNKSMKQEDQYICPVMRNLIDQLEERNIPLAESRMSDYHFHEFYFRVNANPEIIKTPHFEGAKVVENCIVCDCHWSTMEFKHIIY